MTAGERWLKREMVRIDALETASAMGRFALRMLAIAECHRRDGMSYQDAAKEVERACCMADTLRAGPV